MRLGFIGGGIMAEAILSSVLNRQLAGANDICVGELRPERGQFLTQKYGVKTTQDNLQAIQDRDLVVLSIKPQDSSAVFGQLSGRLTAAQTLMSILAGTKLATLTEGFKHASVIRVMPNTPAQIGCGMSVWTCAQQVSQEARDQARAILGSIGQERYVDDEKYLDMATALNGSGPAYVFLFIEALIDAGVYVGLPRDAARQLALQTVYGSARMVMDTGKHPAELKDMVVSPGGTTAEGVQALEQGGVPAAIVEAVKAAYEKSIMLGQG